MSQMNAGLDRTVRIAIDGRGAREGATEVVSSFKAVGDQASAARRETLSLERGLGSIIQVAGGVKGALAVAFGGATLAGTILGATREALRYESALVTVRNSSSLTADQTRALSREILGMTATSATGAEELLNLAAASLRLGISGTENVTKFVTAVDMLGKTTDAKGEAAADALSVLLKLSGESASKAQALAAAVNAQSSAFNASAVAVLSNATALQQSARQGEQSVAQSVAIAAALERVAVDGGQAAIVLSRVSKAIPEDFVSRFGGSRIEALPQFLRALGQLDSKSGEFQRTLERLNLEDAKTQRTLLPLISAAAELERALSSAGDEVGQLAQFQEEYGREVGKTESQLGKLKNQLSAMAAGFGQDLTPASRESLKFINAVVAELRGVGDTGQRTSAGVQLTATAIRLAAGAAAGLTALRVSAWLAASTGESALLANAMRVVRIETLGATLQLTTMGASTGRATALAAAGLGVVRAGVAGVSSAVGTLYAALGPAGWLALGIGAVVAIAPSYSDGMGDMGSATNRFAQEADAARRSADGLRDSLADLRTAQSTGVGSGAAASFAASGIRRLITEIGRARDSGSGSSAALAEQSGVVASILRESGDRRLQEIGARFMGAGAGGVAVPGMPSAGREQQLSQYTNQVKLLTEAVAILENRASGAAGAVDGLNSAAGSGVGALRGEEMRLRGAAFGEVISGMNADYARRRDPRLAAQDAAEKSLRDVYSDRKLGAPDPAFVEGVRQQAAYYYDLAKATDEWTDASKRASAEREREKERIQSANKSLAEMVDRRKQELAVQSEQDPKAKLRMEANQAADRYAGSASPEDVEKARQALLKLADAEAELEASRESRRKADETAREAQRASDEYDQAYSALVLESKLIGKTNDERERAIELARVHALAEKAFGAGTESAARQVEAYAGLLKKVSQERKQSGIDELIADRKRQADSTLTSSPLERKYASDFDRVRKESEDTYGKGDPRVQQNIDRLKRELEGLDFKEKFAEMSDNLGDAVGGFAESALMDIRNVGDAFEGLFKQVQRDALRSLVTQPLSQFVTGAANSLFGALFAAPGVGPGKSMGGFLSQGSDVAINYAMGGVTSRPYAFPMSGGRVGRASEYGQEEAIIPVLGRSPSGRVQVGLEQRGGGRSGSTYVNMRVYANDADSFRRSGRQAVRDMQRRMR